MIEPFQVEGLQELQRALGQIGPNLKVALNNELRLAALPVARTAERLAMTEISGMRRYRTKNWSQMRVGANSGLIYVVPKQRGQRRQRRPNLVNLMLRKSMEPAARKQQPVVVASVARAVNKALQRAGV